MAILTGSEIRKQVQAGRIIIEPYREDQLNPNSYNLTLGDEIKFYDFSLRHPFNQSTKLPQLLTAKPNKDGSVTIWPKRIYLGNTVERVGSSHYVPVLDGRSGFARLGLTAQLSAGFGDLGFVGQWTLEITAAQPAVVWPGRQVCQVSFHTVEGEIEILYKGSYQGQSGPTASRIAL